MRARKSISLVPPPALSGSGLMGVISARYIKAPLRFSDKDNQTFLINKCLFFIKRFYK